MEYIIVLEKGAIPLTYEVNKKKIKMGYKPIGGVSIDEYRSLYVQAMIKE